MTKRRHDNRIELACPICKRPFASVQTLSPHWNIGCRVQPRMGPEIRAEFIDRPLPGDNPNGVIDTPKGIGLMGYTP